MTGTIIKHDLTDDGLSNMGIIRPFRIQILVNQEVVKEIEKFLKGLDFNASDGYPIWALQDKIKEILGVKIE